MKFATAMPQSTAANAVSLDTPIFLELPEVGEFTRLALWMAGSLAGLASLTHAAQGRHFRTMAKRLGWPVRRREGEPVDHDAGMRLFSDAVVGTSRNAIASVFGLPRYTVSDSPAASADSVWPARVWYFTLARRSAMAVAIEFKNHTASRVVFVSWGRDGP